MIRRPPRSTQSRSSAASDVYKRQELAERGVHVVFTGHGDHPLDLAVRAYVVVQESGSGVHGAELCVQLVLAFDARECHSQLVYEVERSVVVGELKHGLLRPSHLLAGEIECLLYTSDAADDLLCVDLG